MKSFALYFAALAVSIPLGGIGLLMVFTAPDLQVIGFSFVVMAGLFAYGVLPCFRTARTNAATAQALKRIAKDAARQYRDEPSGVHWIWWVLAIFAIPALIGIPALLVIAIIHTGRKNRALARELSARNIT